MVFLAPSEVELALESTFARDKKRFKYADVNHDGGVDNDEFVFFMHPEYNKEAVSGGEKWVGGMWLSAWAGVMYTCACVYVCVGQGVQVQFMSFPLPISAFQDTPPILSH